MLQVKDLKQWRKGTPTESGAGQSTVVSGEENGRWEWELGARPRKEAGGRQRMVSENHTGR